MTDTTLIQTFTKFRRPTEIDPMLPLNNCKEFLKYEDLNTVICVAFFTLLVNKQILIYSQLVDNNIYH